MTATEPSPLNLLIKHREKDDPSLSDALVLTFNHDLSFFEREALGLLQLTGARLTVIGDAGATGHDVYGVQRAGTAYLPGLAACAGAFHPKLVALVGATELTVAIGSGNVTLAGWRGNDELWSVHRSWTNGGSTVPAQVGRFLSQLPEVIRVVPAVSEVLHRVGNALTAFAGDLDEHRVVSSLNEPIIDQLPTGPVDELLLYAPFHDEPATAVRRLVERFGPTTVRIAYQPESTYMSGAAVAAAIAGRGELFPIPNAPYRHGKLIEWAIGSSRWALTGSPNLSAAALLRTARTGGNVELGVISPITSTLMPEPLDGPNAVAPLPAFPKRPEKSGPADTILAAIADDIGVTITMTRPLTADATVEYSRPEDPPERWQDGGPIPAGSLEHHLGVSLPGGSRVRVTFAGGAATPVAFVASLTTVNRVRSTRRLGPRTPEITDVLADPETAEKFWSILRAENNQVRAPQGMRRAAERHATDADRSTVMGDWSSYLDKCRGQFGAQLLSFALGLPELQPDSPTAERRVIDWDSEAPIEDEIGLLEDDDATTTVVDDRAEESIASIRDRLSDALRQKYRTFAERRAEETAHTEPHETLVALRLVLLLAAGEVWGSSDLTWTELVLKATSALDGCEGEELETAGGSLAALALAIVDRTYRISTSRIDRAAFRTSVQRVAHLLVAADRQRIEEYRKGLHHFDSCTDPADVLRLRDLLVNDDPLELGLKALDDAAIDYTRNGALLLLDKATSNPLLHARNAASIGARLDNVVLRAPAKTPGQWAAVVRSQGDLIEIRTGALPRSVLVNHARRTDGRWVEVANANVKQPLPVETTAVLQRLGLTIDDLHDA